VGLAPRTSGPGLGGGPVEPRTSETEDWWTLTVQYPVISIFNSRGLRPFLIVVFLPFPQTVVGAGVMYDINFEAKRVVEQRGREEGQNVYDIQNKITEFQ
jgi:hypothetical protein